MTLPIADFIIQRLLEFDPTFDVGAGTPQVGLGIDPLSIILQPIVDELTVVQQSQSILTILESSDPDSFPEDIVDGLASNALVERQPGDIGSDVERVRFFEPQAYSAQKGVLIWRGPSNQRYTNSEAVAITRAEMSLNQDGTLYFVDIPIIALEQGADFNTSAGTITAMEAEPAGVANSTNLFGVTKGLDRETNTELIDRIKVAVTVRALVTGRGIVVTLTENFTSIREIEPIGFGDPEMMRDIVYEVHIGGNVDVYVKTTSFLDGETDVIALKIDSTRRNAAIDVVTAVIPSVGYSLARQSIDRTDAALVVRSLDGAATYVEGVDFSVDDAAGLIFRLPNAVEDPLDPTPSSIFHQSSTAAVATTNKLLDLVGAFGNARVGMIITVDTPAQIAGTYTVKTVVTSAQVEIFGEFPGAGFPIAAVDFTMDESLSVLYEYNPVAIDIAREVRGPTREGYTITDVPMMLIESIEVLDSVSGEPTGVFLSGAGGFGAGGFGMGGFGMGSIPDYRLVVPDPTLRFSWLESNYIEFSGLQLGVSVRVTYKHASAVPALQAFCDDRNNQSQSASLVVKTFLPVFVESTSPIEYQIAPSDSVGGLTVEEMTEKVNELIDDIDEEKPLEISDIIDLLYDNGANWVDVEALMGLVGEMHLADATVSFIAPDAKGVMSIPDSPIEDPTTRPMSPRIVRFIPHGIVLQRTVAS